MGGAIKKIINIASCLIKIMINKYKYLVNFLLMCVFSMLFSQNAQDIFRMKSEYEKFKNEQGLPGEVNVQGSEADIELDPPQESQLTRYVLPATEIDERVQFHFGYDFFTLRDTVPFWENLPSPPNYILGAGDELIISLWGETQLRETYTISREGKIYDDKVGLLNLSGRSIVDARKYIKVQFARVYATLTNKSPTTFIDVSLGDLKSINVNFVGMVKYPGVHPVHSFSNLITGLIQAGGVDTTGTLRNIKIKRNGDSDISVDLYDFFINGEISSSIQLRDQDIVVVPHRNSIVKIDSAVVRPGIYESIAGETIYDLISYAGGPTYDASQSVSLWRLNPQLERKTGQAYEGSYLEYVNTKIVPVFNGDEIIMRRLFLEELKVEIIGQIKAPGDYHYYNGMRLNDLLKLGGGFDDSTFIKSIYLGQAEIIRRSPDSRYDEVISVNLRNIFDDNVKQNYLLNNLDRIVVHANSNFFKKENIQIYGEVNIPGSYPLVRDDESLESILQRAGGITSKALSDGISIYRNKEYFETKISNQFFIQPRLENNEENADIFDNDNLNNNNQRIRVAWKNEKIALMPGDSIVVKQKLATVYVSGAVYNPGVLEFNNQNSLRSYLNAAGGLTELANKKAIIVLYPNGVVAPKKWYYSPKILEGSTIIVNQKEITEPFDITRFATDFSVIVSSVVSVLVLSRQL